MKRAYKTAALMVVVMMVGPAGQVVADDKGENGRSKERKSMADSDKASQGVDRGIRLAKYKGDKRGAVSFTFDDGFRNQVKNTVEILDPLGIKGTFFVIPLYIEDAKRAANVVTWERAKQLQAAGHEIGTHGSIKEKLHEASDERLDYLVNESARLIAKNTGVKPVSYALPGGSKADKRVASVVLANHYVIRNAKLMPDLKTIGYGSTDRRKWTDEATRKQIEAARESGQWVVAIVHAIVEGYSPFKSKDEFRTHCKWVKDQKDIWVAPIGVVGCYVKAREASKLKVIESEPGKVRFSLSCDLKPAEVFAKPLTVVIPAVGATAAKAACEKGPTPDVSVQGESILVDAVPNGEAVTVRWDVAGK